MKLLIEDMLPPNACADGSAVEGAHGSVVRFPLTKDSPLLPNVRVGSMLGYFMDILVRHRFSALPSSVTLGLV